MLGSRASAGSRSWSPEPVAIANQGRIQGEDFELLLELLEDVDGDGRAEKVTVFAEGLNIPSGIAVGHGGVWVAFTVRRWRKHGGEVAPYPAEEPA